VVVDGSDDAAEAAAAGEGAVVQGRRVRPYDIPAGV